jgi:hypothetical protein
MIMKIIQMKFLAITCIFLLLAFVVKAQVDDYHFLVSGIRTNDQWCITATNGAGDFVNLGFRECDFVGAPSTQLWRLRADGTMESAVESGRCMIVNYGTELFPGVRIRMSSCEPVTQNNQFQHNGATDQLRLVRDNTFCVTNRGTNPNYSDTIHALPCQDQGRFFFTYTPIGESAPPVSSPVSSPVGDFLQYTTGGGCITVEGSNAINDQKLRLESCSRPNNGWRVDGNGMLHTELDDSKCMHAGRTATPVHGTPMRIFDCDPANPFQLFERLSNGQIVLRDHNLCVDHRGVNANVNVDPIILKECSAAGGWETSNPATGNDYWQLI